MRSILVLCVLLVAQVASAFDTSAYRAITYGRSPDRYCDPTKSLADSSGDGLSEGTAWNLTQCQTQPTAGQIVGVMPGVSVNLAASASVLVPAFYPRNSGSSGSPIIYVTKYAAVALGSTIADITASANKTQLRHDGAGVTCTGTAGGAILGIVGGTDYTYFDGFYIDVASAKTIPDSGVLMSRAASGANPATGNRFLNMVIVGDPTMNCDSNCVVWRPDTDVDTILSNIWIDSFVNHPSGCALGQPSWASDMYGSQNYTIKNTYLTNSSGSGTYNGWFAKGTGAFGAFNYGTMQYNLIDGADNCLRMNDWDASGLTTIHNNLCQNYGTSGITFGSETTHPRNVLVHHNTIAVGCTGLGCGGIVLNAHTGEGTTSLATRNVTTRDNLVDVTSGSQRMFVDAQTFNANISTINYNGYYTAGGAPKWGFNGSSGITTLAGWQAVTGTPDLNVAAILSSDPFVNRASNNFHCTGTCATMSSTGGEVGAYGGLGSNVLGLDLGDVSSGATGSGSTRISGSLRFFGSVRIQ